MHRTIATHFVVLIVGLTIGVGAVAVADQGTARSAAADSRIVQRLDTLNKNVRGIDRQLGGYPDTGVTPTKTVITALDDLKRGLDNIDRGQGQSCRAVAEHSYDCP